MIISDLEHLEIVSETKIEGSVKRFNLGTSPVLALALATGFKAPIAGGDGQATVTAVGAFTDIVHDTDTQLAAGLFSKGTSFSGGIALG